MVRCVCGSLLLCLVALVVAHEREQPFDPSGGHVHHMEQQPPPIHQEAVPPHQPPIHQEPVPPQPPIHQEAVPPHQPPIHQEPVPPQPPIHQEAAPPQPPPIHQEAVPLQPPAEQHPTGTDDNAVGGTPTINRHTNAHADHRFDGSDKEHLQEHMDGVVNAGEALSDEESNFRFFTIHDYDKNNKLDGLELMAALTDHHQHGSSRPAFREDEMTSLIDDILKNSDNDADGYIDYSEFAAMQVTA